MGKGQTRPLTVVNSACIGTVVQQGRVPHIIKTVFDRIRYICNIGGACQIKRKGGAIVLHLNTASCERHSDRQGEEWLHG
ncbi:hypothetical protein [Nostoc sp.]|uniref:hypothetical protein n=1 Tax=Nostoc sp. TaxID=1180 RepID=UPI002FFA7757